MDDEVIAKKNNVKITFYPINARCQSAGVCMKIQNWNISILERSRTRVLWN